MHLVTLIIYLDWVEINRCKFPRINLWGLYSIIQKTRNLWKINHGSENQSRSWPGLWSNYLLKVNSLPYYFKLSNFFVHWRKVRTKKIGQCGKSTWIESPFMFMLHSLTRISNQKPIVFLLNICLFSKH